MTFFVVDIMGRYNVSLGRLDTCEWVSVFFALARYRVIKIVHSCSEMVLRTMKNYKAHYSLPWFRPLL
jgi:hypothetical protein